MDIVKKTSLKLLSWITIYNPAKVCNSDDVMLTRVGTINIARTIEILDITAERDYFKIRGKKTQCIKGILWVFVYL